MSDLPQTEERQDSPIGGSVFADRLTALASELREADLASQEVRQLSQALTHHTSQLGERHANTGATPTTRGVGKGTVRSGRVLSLVAVVVLVFGGFGVAGALPAPVQILFDDTVHAVTTGLTRVTSGEPDVDVEPSTRPATDEPLGSSGYGAPTMPVPDPELLKALGSSSGEAPVGQTTGDAHRSETASAVLTAVSVSTSGDTLKAPGLSVAEVASDGKSGGTAAEDTPSGNEGYGRESAPGQNRGEGPPASERASRPDGSENRSQGQGQGLD